LFDYKRKKLRNWGILTKGKKERILNELKERKERRK
jgi:predicted Fe-S protein YdhL (DUF1289 family)